MSRKRRIHNPFNFGFKVMYNDFPRELHSSLNVPGIFKKKSNVKVFRKNDSTLEMDSSYVANPDYETLFESVEYFKDRLNDVEAENLEFSSKLRDLEVANSIANGKISDLEAENLVANGKISDLEAGIS